MRYLIVPTLMAAFAASAVAEQFTVTNTNDSGPGSLRAAIAAAAQNPGADSIVFQLADCGGACTIRLTSGELVIIGGVGALDISHPITAEPVIVDAGGTSRVMQIAVGAEVDLSGLTITGGRAYEISGGGILNRGKATLSYMKIHSNYNDYAGGGISNADTGNMKILKSEVFDNQAEWYGGGVFNLGNLSIADSTIATNYGPDVWGGGLYSIDGIDSKLFVTNSTFSSNRGSWGGGMMIPHGYMTAYLSSITVTNNIGGGMAADCLFQGTAEVINSIVSGNEGGDVRSCLHVEARSSLIGQPAMLGPLAYNGGYTRTHALLPGSPAIDVGNACVGVPDSCWPAHPALDFDQRGYRRSGAPDVGAFESGGFFEIRGRVLSPSGQALRGATVTLVDELGRKRVSTTSSFGSFQFDDIPTSIYTITAVSKRYRFTAQTLTVNNASVNADLVGAE